MALVSIIGRTFARAAAFAIIGIWLASNIGVAEVAPQEGADLAHDKAGRLEAYVDGLVQAHMSEHDLPGLTLSVVKNGKPALIKGYGYANLEAREPVDAEHHLFRVGSISKTFIWVSVMQLVERGVLDLDTDINEYLADMQIPETFDEPVTLHHLMSHTAGFDTITFTNKFAVATPEEVISFDDYMRRNLPPRVRPPGEWRSYSNYDSSLAAYIVQSVTGMPYEDYVEENVFKPLNMTSSTFREPLGANHPDSIDPELQTRVVMAYTTKNGALEPTVPYYHFHAFPSGSLKSTAADMAKYMEALVTDGATENGRILKATTLQRMRQRSHEDAPEAVGIANGFFEQDIGGVRTLGHGGSVPGSNSLMEFVPGEGLGVFVSYSTWSTTAPSEIPKHVIRYIKGEISRPERLVPPSDFSERADRFTGTYRAVRRNHHNLESIAYLFAEGTVRTTEDGRLLASLFGRNTAFIETAPLTFRAVDGRDTLTFRTNETGEVTHLVNAAGLVAERLSPLNTSAVFFRVVGASVLLSLTTLLAAWFRRFSDSASGTGRKWLDRALAGAPLTASVLVLLFAVVFSQAFSQAGDVQFQLDWPNGLIVLSQWIALAYAVSVVTLVLGMPSVWRVAGPKNGWVLSRQLHYTLLAISLCALLVLMWNWNLIGFQY
ncbi:MAG: serine hydrolase domain-containing protein [Pseudomonadota bacterium]